MATDEGLLRLAEQAQGPPASTGAIDPSVLARQVPPGTPGAEGPVFKDPNAAPLIDPVIAAQTPALAPVEPATPAAAPPPAQPAAPAQAAPIAPVAQGTPSIGNAAKAYDIATQQGFETAEAQKAVGKAKADQIRGDAAGQHEVAKVAQTNADELARQLATQQKAADDARKIADKDQAEHESAAHGILTLMENKADAQLARARIFIALGAAGNALAGGGNPALEKLKLTIDNDFKSQSQKLRSEEHWADVRSKKPASLAAQFQEDNARLTLKHAAAYKAASDEAKAGAIARGATPEEAENNVVAQQTKQLALEKNAHGRMELEKARASEMMAGAHLALARSAQLDRKAAAEDKAPTQGESENASRGRNMKLALDGLNAPDMAGYKPSPEAVQKWLSNQERIEAASENNKSLPGQGVNYISRKFDAIPKNELDGLDEKDKKYFTLARQYIEPYARKNSGSAINAGEWKGFDVQVGPTGGEAGRKLAAQAADDMVTLGGRATKNLEKADAAAGKATPGKSTAPKSQGRRVKFRGQMGTLVGDEFTPDAP